VNDVTVFTASVYPDLARLWLATTRRAFPSGTPIEIFHDTEVATELPGARAIARSTTVRDFHEAYDDALRSPTVAAVAALRRDRVPSPGTFAVVMKAEPYRRALEGNSHGFFPAIEGLDPATPPESWTRHDTADLAARAVVTAGHEIRFLAPSETDLVRFDGLTLSRRAAGFLGRRALARLAADDDYYWHGWLGNALLARLHDRLFANAPRYDFHLGFARPLLQSLRGPRGRIRYLARLAAGSRTIARAITGGPD